MSGYEWWRQWARDPLLLGLTPYASRIIGDVLVMEAWPWT